MANQEHLSMLKQGVNRWNEWRRQHESVQPDLCNANLSGANLEGVRLNHASLREANLNHTSLCYADLEGSDLSHADLSGANLLEANLYGANLLGANLSHAGLSKANFFQANLLGANLSRAFLHRTYLSLANLSYATLSDAHFSSAHFSFTILNWVNLCEVRGLDTVIHEGPSAVDPKTVKLPEGKTRLHFLRGVGFSDTFIDYYDSLFTEAFQYASCFISYAHQDEALAHHLYKDLQHKGVRCWFAPHDMRIGDKIRARIDEAIHMQDKLLLLLSEYALASPRVEDEVEAALEKERQQQREVLFPVRLDESVMHTTQAWAATLRRTRHIGDFTNWVEPQAYQSAFDRLLRDLKKADELGDQEKKP